MRALVCRKPGDLTIEDRPEPAPGAGEVIVQIRRVGICGTDYHIFEGAHPYLQYPRVMGHELCAEVLEPNGSSRFRVGQLLVVNPYVSCGNCHACQKGKPNCCARISVLGVHRDGGMCERLSIPEANLYPAGELSPEAAASVEFLAIGAHSVRRAAISAGTRTLIVGAGPIGIGAALFARIAGADVTLMDRDAGRLELAAALVEANGSVLADGQSADAIAKMTGGDGFDVVMDATGSRASIESAFRHVAHGGNYVLVSVIKDDVTFSDAEFHKREMTLIASRNALTVDFDHVMASMRAGKVPVDKLVTHRTSLAGTATDLPRWATQKQGLIKAMIEVA